MAKSLVPSSSAAVIQIWSPQTTGLDQPRSWRGVFHLTCSVSLHVVGRPLASERLSPLGPRNCGQLSAAASETASDAISNETNTTNRDMTEPQLFSSRKKVWTV